MNHKDHTAGSIIDGVILHADFVRGISHMVGTFPIADTTT